MSKITLQKFNERYKLEEVKVADKESPFTVAVIHRRQIGVPYTTSINTQEFEGRLSINPRAGPQPNLTVSGTWKTLSSSWDFKT